MKGWDEIVFRSLEKKNRQEGDPMISTAQNQAKYPDPKIILLAGPPGTCKTTLAHTVARQAGYNPVEVNAR